MSFFRPSATAKDVSARRARPKLWVKGQQKPRFDPAAFARVSLTLARRAARPALIWLADFTAGLARRMANNRLGPRLGTYGRLGRALPSRTALSGGFAGLAAVLSAAADVAVPPPPADPVTEMADQPMSPAPRSRRAALRLADRDPGPVAAASPAPPSAPEQPAHPLPDASAPDPALSGPILDSIRALMAQEQAPPAVTPRRPVPAPVAPAPPPMGGDLLQAFVPLHPPEPRPPTRAERLRARAFRAGAAGLAWSMTLLSLPVGASRALFLHLNNEDLRDWS